MQGSKPIVIACSVLLAGAANAAGAPAHPVRKFARVVLAMAGCFMGAASACTPVPWDTVGGVAQLPPEVQTLLLEGGAVADPGWPYSAGDFGDMTLPLRRLRLAVVGLDCVRADVEQSGRGGAYTLLYQLTDGHWKQLGGKHSLDHPDGRLFQQKSLGGASYP